MSEDIFKELMESVLSFDKETVIEVTQRAVEHGISSTVIIEQGLAKGLQRVGQKFEAGELFLMHMVAAAEAAQAAIDTVLKPVIAMQQEKRKSRGVVVIGTVEGDIHDIGKNIVGAFLIGAGFEVHDIGVDRAAETFVEKALEVNADVIGASALLSTTLPQQREVVKAVEEVGLRNKVKLIFGGSPVTREWVEEIGGDGYAPTAAEGVKVVQSLLGIPTSDSL